MAIWPPFNSSASSVRSLLYATATTTSILSIFLLTILAECGSIRYVLVRNGEWLQDGKPVYYYNEEIDQLGGGGSWTVGIACYEGDDGGVAGADLITSRLVAFAVGSVEEFDTARQSFAADEQWVNLRGKFLNIVRVGFAPGNDHRKKEFITQMANKLSAHYEAAAHPGSGGDGDLMGMVYPITISASFTAMKAAHMFQMVAAEFQKYGFQRFRRVGYRFELCKAFKEGGIHPIQITMPVPPVGAPFPDNGFSAGPTHGAPAMQGSAVSSDVSDYKGQPSQNRLIKCEHILITKGHLMKPNRKMVSYDTEIKRIYAESGGQGSVHWERGVGYFESFDNWATREMFAFAVGGYVQLNSQLPPQNDVSTQEYYAQLSGRFLIILTTDIAPHKGEDAPILSKMAQELYDAYKMTELSGLVFLADVSQRVGKKLANELMDKHNYQLYRLAGNTMELYIGFHGKIFPAVDAPLWSAIEFAHPPPAPAAAIPPQQQPAMNMEFDHALTAMSHQSSGVPGGAGSSSGGGGDGDCQIVLRNGNRLNGSEYYVLIGQEIQQLYTKRGGEGHVDWVEGCACYESTDEGHTHQLYAFAVGGFIPLAAATPAVVQQLEGEFLHITFVATTKGLNTLVKMANKLYSHYNHSAVTAHNLAGMLYPVNLANPIGEKLAEGLKKNGFKPYRQLGTLVEFYRLFGDDNLIALASSNC